MRSPLTARCIPALVAAALPILCGAATPPGDASAVVRETLKSRFPDVQILNVQPAVMPGLYEVFTGDSIAYADATGDHLFVGSMLDTRTKRDLTAERVDELNSIDFSTLPLDRAIKTVKGDGSRKLAIFSDPDCPFCQKLEHELTSITDVTIYTFLYPLASIHPDAPAKAHAIWCAKDRTQAWSDWMLARKAPTAAATCDGDPIEELQALGRKLRINSTPTLFVGTGKRFGGTLEAAKLDQMLGKAASAPTAGAAAGASPAATSAGRGSTP